MQLKQPRVWTVHPGLFGIIALSGAMFLNGCGGSQSNFSISSNPGANVAVGNGTAHSYVSTDNAGTPRAIGIVMSAAALKNEALPVAPAQAVEYLLPLPTGAPSLPFKSISLFTTPGHPPTVYQLRHFHVGFSQYTAAQRASITTDDPHWDAAVPTKYTPHSPIVSYVDFQQLVNGLGTIYFNPLIPEFNGKPFATEVDYAFFDGNLSSWNVTANGTVVEDASNNPLPVNIKEPLDLPDAYQEAGYYPTTYTIRYDAPSNSLIFELGDMVYRQAG